MRVVIPLKSKKKLLTVIEVAEQCSIAADSVRRLTDRGAMPQPVRLGRSVRYRADEIDAWIEERCPDLAKTEASNCDVSLPVV